jgi:hypothetical protein
MAHMGEHLPSKHETLSSTLNTIKKKKARKIEKIRIQQ